MMEIIGSIAAAILAVILEEIIRRDSQRKNLEKKQVEKIEAIIEAQKSLLHSQMEHQKTVSGLKKDSQLMRVDLQSCVYALEKASNGIPFKQYIAEKRDELMRKLEYSYED